MEEEKVNDWYRCKKCGSKNITIKPGMFVDLMTCKNCGWEDHI